MGLSQYENVRETLIYLNKERLRKVEFYLESKEKFACIDP